MKKPILLVALATVFFASHAQVGIGTTSPTTTLDVRGSIAINTRSFSTTSESVASTDFNLLFTGTSACTVTLPDATAFTGRLIHVKNTKTSSVPILTIATTSSQTIDGASTFLLDDANEAVHLISNGSNWLVMGSATSWTLGGNTVSSEKKLGTVDNYGLPFITNNTERMRISNSGNVAIGTSSFDGTNPEKLLIDAGTTSSFNLLVAKGTKNGYLQLNIQNLSSGNAASSDVVASANNASETVNFVNLGINSSSYTPAANNILNGVNTAYLFSTGNDFFIGNQTSNKNLVLYAGGDQSTNERIRITPSSGVQVTADVLPISNNAYNLGSSSLRWSTIYSNNSLNTSDARLKTNIGALSYGLSTVLQMQSVQYHWKEGVDKDLKMGFLAQDLRKIIPEVVVGDERKEDLAVNYIELIPVLVNAIKEQQAQIDQLKAKVKALENKK